MSLTKITKITNSSPVIDWSKYVDANYCTQVEANLEDISNIITNFRDAIDAVDCGDKPNAPDSAGKGLIKEIAKTFYDSFGDLIKSDDGTPLSFPDNAKAIHVCSHESVSLNVFPNTMYSQADNVIQNVAPFCAGSMIYNIAHVTDWQSTCKNYKNVAQSLFLQDDVRAHAGCDEDSHYKLYGNYDVDTFCDDESFAIAQSESVGNDYLDEQNDMGGWPMSDDWQSLNAAASVKVVETEMPLGVHENLPFYNSHQEYYDDFKNFKGGVKDTSFDEESGSYHYDDIFRVKNAIGTAQGCDQAQNFCGAQSTTGMLFRRHCPKTCANYFGKALNMNIFHNRHHWCETKPIEPTTEVPEVKPIKPIIVKPAVRPTEDPTDEPTTSAEDTSEEENDNTVTIAASAAAGSVAVIGAAYGASSLFSGSGASMADAGQSVQVDMETEFAERESAVQIDAGDFI